MINFFGSVHAGGCDGEALGAAELLRSRDVPVRFILPPSQTLPEHATTYLRSIGVELAAYTPGLFKTCRVLVSFGDARLFDYIREHNDRPAFVVYSDGRHFVTDNEIAQHRAGTVDEFFFQTRAIADRNGPELSRRAGKRVTIRAGYRAYINPDSRYLRLRYDPAAKNALDQFNVLRVACDEADRWHPGTWRMMCGITAPSDTPVHIEVAGWGPVAAEKIGDPLAPGNKWQGELDTTLHPWVDTAAGMSALYARSHVLVHLSDYTWEDTISRTILEAMAAGVVVITDRRGGSVDLIRDGETGWLVDSPEEASYRASQMAWEPALRRAIAAQAYAELITAGHGCADSCFPWWERLVQLSAAPA